MDTLELRRRVESSLIVDDETVSRMDIVAGGYGSVLGCLTALYSAGVPEVVRVVDDLFPREPNYPEEPADAA